MIETTVLAAVGGEDIEGIQLLLPAFYDLLFGGLSFVILLVLFWKFALPRAQQVLDKRTDSIQGGIARAEQQEQEAAQLLSQYREQLAGARNEAAKIRTQAQSERDEIVTQAKTEASSAAEQIKIQATTALEAERGRVVTNLRKEVGDLALALAEKVLGESLKDDAKAKAVVERFIADIEKSAGKK
ncbi:MAG: F0F1 ATP synthase subunit B [Actinobacteria bacterium]|jgi:F-type H+-transporting ATPase subunit b|nr:F0F1 ATP synthase subunit B [Actinomycetota bacterium]MDA2975533.1 F0F1 ATP synthase subunit B [Actinomycetota bacterium]